MADDAPCYCAAYPFPHRPGGGKCRATGQVQCPSCSAVLDDDQLAWALWAAETVYYPAEYVPVLLRRCGRCGALGAVV